MPYVELHCHSAYSFLDGASLPEELVASAARLGYGALALTDHNGVFGSMEHEQAARALGVRAIHGAEVDVTDPVGDRHAAGTRHLTLLVQDARGWRNLCHLLTEAHAHTRAPDGGRVVLAPSVPLERVLELSEGLVCLSGCARRGVRDEPTLRRLLGAFGPGRLRVELQRPFWRHDRARNRGMAALARRLGVPAVATGNVHAHSRARGRLQDAFVAIREHATLDASEPLRRGNHSSVLASPAAMAARFADHPDAVAETERLAERLRFDLGADLGYRYPGADDEDADRALAERCWAAMDVRYPAGHRLRSEAHGRLEEELRVIRSLGLSGFFILHADLLELARTVAAEVRGPSTARGLLPPGRGRGSSVSSIVCYLTGLSHIDPVENDLFLGRFLNEELTALPDIDLDFPRDVREVLIPRVHEQYGSQHSALVAAFPTYRSRGAIREIGKALGLPPGEIERVAKVAEPWAQSVEEDVELALGAAAEAAEGTATNRAAGAMSDPDAASPAASPSGAAASGAAHSRAADGATGADPARAAARAASAAAIGSRPEASPPAADFVGASCAETRPKPWKTTHPPLPDDRGPSPPGPPPWTPEAGRRAMQEAHARRAESRSTTADLGEVARNRYGGPDPALARVAHDGNSGTALAVLTDPMLRAAEAAGSVSGAITAAATAHGSGFHDAYGDTQAREARTSRTAFNHGDKGWEPPSGDGSGRSLAGTGGGAAAGRAAGAAAGPGAPSGAGAQAASASGVLQGRWGWLAGLAQEAYGLPRHLSQHPGGMIVSTRPLIDCVPLVPAAMAGRQMCHWDKDSCADAGFLKIDLLGLGMLSAVERCVEEIARVRTERIDLSRIPFDDKPTYDAIQAADTMGVFQIESRAQMQSLLRTRPETLDDLTIQVAIVRPGPIVGGAVNPYIDRKQRLRADPDFQIPYDHPSLESVLKDTLGTIIFQDQVIEVAQAFAGFSPGEAEGLRRAMSRKRSAAAMEAHHERFVAGAQRTNGADRETAERVFTMIAGFSGFGFPKAHGAAFGLLAYQSTWLRVHYKPEFTTALLNEQPMGFYPSDTLVHEAQRTGIEVRAPDVNASRVLCHVEDPGVAAAGTAGGGDVAGAGATGGGGVAGSGAAPRARVRIGLGYLNGAREAEVRTIVAEREANGPYASLGELASRSGVSRQALSVLAWSGACDGLIGARTASARRTALWRLGMAAPAAKAGDGSQLALPLELPDAPPLAPLQAWERMVADYATTGLTAGPHPMGLAREVLPADVASSADLVRLRHGARLRIGGLVVARQRPATANGIVFMLLEDEHGTINLVVPPETYDRDRLVVRGEPLVFAEGRLEKHPKAAGAINIVVDRLRPLDLGPADAEVAQVVALSAAARVEGGGNDELADAEPVEPWLPAVAAAGGGSRSGGAGSGGGGHGEGGQPGDVRDFAAVAPPVQSFGQGRR